MDGFMDMFTNIRFTDIVHHNLNFFLNVAEDRLLCMTLNLSNTIVLPVCDHLRLPRCHG